MSLRDTYETRKEEWNAKRATRRKVSDGGWIVLCVVMLFFVFYTGTYVALWFVLPCVVYKVLSFAGFFDKKRERDISDDEWAEKATEYEPSVRKYHQNVQSLTYRTRRDDTIHTERLRADQIKETKGEE